MALRHDQEEHRRQASAIFQAWGMPPEKADQTSRVLTWADLHGIESHGIAMIVEYNERRSNRPINFQSDPYIVRETPVSALMDGDGGLGHYTATKAMELAVHKAQAAGVGLVSVRNSGHFGALGYFTSMAADAGLIGIAATSVFGIRVPPTGGAKARFGTDPWSFAAPGAAGEPFVLDMATTTVASGKVRNKLVEGQPLPEGWGFDSSGRPTTDPSTVMNGGFLSPLGGTAESGGHKGYGLAVMVNILASCLSGSTLITDPMHSRQPKGLDVGHFFMAFDPGLFREAADFRADVARLCNDLRATPPVDPSAPVLVAGDPERSKRAAREADGIPMGPGLLARLRTIADGCGAAWHLSPATQSASVNAS
ncbi:Malate/lactate/ureidoglycolate dehydrogenase, LDH2 family [Aureimonas altamirensis DSM 21988]|uniref:Malate/lactate/ureidoglycolate dehydrogenase, LDH2 family n=1 Tax=Aureimonas altamirensis DSM 21988 TaxID=1121026 RepID=A0ABY1IJP7_9HYPH|nr:Ldh family oxidoreductase [Aureimonas altamirensis]SHJ26655.1 Malate/lactate/ureidoglycolate dehydrogenase, LDH2 family [Aureimonas altamirensis DSM 21988]